MAGSGRRLAHQFIWVSSGRLLAAVLQAVSLVLAARLLEPEAFGHLAAFLGVTTIAQVGIDLGVSTFVTRERAAEPGSGAVASALKFTTRSSTALAAVLACGLGLAGAVLSSSYWAMLPLALWAAAERNADARLSVAFADGDVHVNVINLLSRRAAAILLFLGGVAAGLETVVAFAIGSAIAAIASASFAQIYIRRRVTVPSSITTRELLARSRPFWVHSVATQARNLDVVLVGSLGGAVQAGLYSSGSRLTSPLRILPTSLATLLLPLSARRQASRRVLRKLLVVTGAVVGAMTLLYAVLFALVPAVVPLVLGDAYDEASGVIRVIVLGLPFAAAVSLLASLLQGRGKGRAVAAGSTTATTVCLLGVAAVAPWSGALGAAWVLSASFVLQFSVLAAGVARLYKESV